MFVGIVGRPEAAAIETGEKDRQLVDQRTPRPVAILSRSTTNGDHPRTEVAGSFPDHRANYELTRHARRCSERSTPPKAITRPSLSPVTMVYARPSASSGTPKPSRVRNGSTEVDEQLDQLVD